MESAFNIEIRKANRSDLQSILDLVIELAVYEKEPEAVTSTIDDYYAAFDSGLIICRVATLGDKVIGMTLSYDYYSTWKGKGFYLEDFYVQPEYRKHGVGKMLFDQFLDDARNRGAKITKWQVLDWNEPAIKFYEKNHAIIETNWWNCKLPVEQR
jgi:GNAT superfamily N-acetyltransferase